MAKAFKGNKQSLDNSVRKRITHGHRQTSDQFLNSYLFTGVLSIIIKQTFSLSRRSLL